MALTNDVILKISKEIKSIIRSEVGIETKGLKNSLTSEIKSSRMTLQLSIGEIEDKIKDIELGQNSDHKLLASIQKEIKKIGKSLNKASNILDTDNLNTLKRIKRVENYLRLPEMNFA